MIKTFKVKLHPTKEQEQKMFQSAGTARWAYNWTLAKQIESKKFINDGELRKELTQLKKSEEFKWLSNVSAQIPKQAIKDACESFKNFFKKQTKFPRFKSRRKHSPSFYNDSTRFKVTETACYLELIGNIEFAEICRIPFKTGAKYLNPRIKYDGLGWYITVGVEVSDIINLDTNSEPVGIDLGIKDLAIVSNGKVFKNINKQKKIKEKIKKTTKKSI